MSIPRYPMEDYLAGRRYPLDMVYTSPEVLANQG